VPERRVIRFEDRRAIGQSGLDPLQPEIVIFEMETMPDSDLLRLLEDYPGIQWIGLDPHCSQVSVYITHRYATKTMKDLFHVIREVLPQLEKNFERRNMAKLEL